MEPLTIIVFSITYSIFAILSVILAVVVNRLGKEQRIRDELLEDGLRLRNDLVLRRRQNNG